MPNSKPIAPLLAGSALTTSTAFKAISITAFLNSSHRCGSSTRQCWQHQRELASRSAQPRRPGSVMVRRKEEKAARGMSSHTGIKEGIEIYEGTKSSVRIEAQQLGKAIDKRMTTMNEYSVFQMSTWKIKSNKLLGSNF